MPVEFDHQFHASADELWGIIGTPDRIDWVPGVISCTFDGEVHSLHLPGAGNIKERILSRDEASKTMEYSCFETPVPLHSHHSSIAIMTNDDGCRLLWETAVAPIEIEKFIRRSMESCIERLTEMLSQPFR